MENTNTPECDELKDLRTPSPTKGATDNKAYYVKFPIFWGTRGKLKARLAAKADAQFRYITASVPQMVKVGLIPADHGLEHGDQFAVLLDGAFLQFKINRKNCATAAVHLPAPFELPSIDDTGFQAKDYEVTVIGPMSQARIVTVNGEVTEAAAEQTTTALQIGAQKASIHDAAPECFEILGLPEDSTTEDAKTAYRELVKAHHPDAGGSDEIMATINAAYGEAMAELASREFQTPQD